MLCRLLCNLDFIVDIHVAAEAEPRVAFVTRPREIIESIIWLAGSVVKNASTPGDTWLSGASADDRRLSGIHPRIQRLFRREFYS